MGWVTQGLTKQDLHDALQQSFKELNERLEIEFECVRAQYEELGKKIDSLQTAGKRNGET